MNGALLLLLGCVCFLLAYFGYSKFVAKALGVDPERKTPAHTMRDGVDYVPAHPAVLFGHHFATIAGAFLLSNLALGVACGMVAHLLVNLVPMVKGAGSSTR